MEPGTAIPAHYHNGKDKFYFADREPSPATIVVFFYHEGKWQKHIFETYGQMLVIPAGTPHCVYCPPTTKTSQTKPSLVVVTTTNDASDILWEAGLDAMLENKHLLAAAA